MCTSADSVPLVPQPLPTHTQWFPTPKGLFGGDQGLLQGLAQGIFEGLGLGPGLPRLQVLLLLQPLLLPEPLLLVLLSVLQLLQLL